jgi:hypothetical protein
MSVSKVGGGRSGLLQPGSLPMSKSAPAESHEGACSCIWSSSTTVLRFCCFVFGRVSTERRFRVGVIKEWDNVGVGVVSPS